MLKIITTILIITTSAFATNLPFQSKEIVEIYRRLEDPIYEDLELTHNYAVFDKIFILPNEFYGESELYDLKFFLDMDTTISNDYDANCYRILYENRSGIVYNTDPIPEPITLVTLMMGFCLIKIKRKKFKLS